MSNAVRDFDAEMSQIKQRLKEMGRDIDAEKRVIDVSGIKCDFDLPYSTLPKLQGSQWNTGLKSD